MSSKVWMGRRLLNALVAFLSSCSCGAPGYYDAGVDAARDAGTDAVVIEFDAGSDGGPQCDLVHGLWRFTGATEDPCGLLPTRFEYSVNLTTLLDARTCPAGCTCVYGIAALPVCDYDWSMVCSDALSICRFRRATDHMIAGQCFTQRVGEPRCDVLWTGMPR